MPGGETWMIAPGVGMERDSAHADGSREHISKVCSQLIIGTPPPHSPSPAPLSFPLRAPREG